MIEPMKVPPQRELGKRLRSRSGGAGMRRSGAASSAVLTPSVPTDTKRQRIPTIRRSQERERVLVVSDFQRLEPDPTASGVTVPEPPKVVVRVACDVHGSRRY